MSSKTASWSHTPGIDTHLSTRKGWVVKKRSIILLSMEGMITICYRSQWKGNLWKSNDILLGY